MNEWFKKTFGTIKEKWSKWTILQKGILIGIAVAVVAVIILMVSMSSRKTTVLLFHSPVTNVSRQRQITTRLDEAGVESWVSSDGYISVANSDLAKEWSAKLVAEGLEPDNNDPWGVFDNPKWTRNKMDDRVNWLRAMEASVEEHLKRLDGIRDADVLLAIPEKSTFSDDQSPVTATVILTAKGGSDVLENKSKIRGIQNVVMRSVEGLTSDNITIMNSQTDEQINDFTGMEAIDRINTIARQEKEIRKLESEYATRVLRQLQSTYGPDRVKITNMTIDMDMSEKTSVSEEYSGIKIKEDNPDTPYDDSEVVQSLKISEETVDKKWTGTGFNPEGVSGVDGQNPPVYSESDNLIGQSEENGAKVNYALNKTTTTEKVSPEKGRRTISVIIDSAYVFPVRDEKGKVVFDEDGLLAHRQIDIPEETLKKLETTVQSAIGYDAQRGDRVTVANIPFDHTEEWKAATENYRREERTKMIILISLAGIAIVLVLFIIFRIVSREIERRRRLREEERLRQQQAEREQALWDAKEQGMEVTLSVEERKRAELQENAIAMAKEHPEDVAMLIRTWLMEE